MRRSFPCLSLAVSLVFLAHGALAQKKPKAEKKADGPSAAATWTDPTENEKSDKGPYAPQSEEKDQPEPDAKAKPKADAGRKRDRIDVFGQLIIGFGAVPLNNPNYDDAPSGKGTALGIMLGGRYDVSSKLSVGLRIPLTTATIKQTRGANIGRNQSTTAFGSPELFGEYRHSLSLLTTIPIAFGVGIPLAQGNVDANGTDVGGIALDQVNRFADATSGWKDSELFQPKRIPIVVGGGIRHERRDFELHADAKFVLLPGYGDKTVAQPVPLAGTYKINPFALREVTTLGGSYNFVDKPLFWGGLDLSLVWTPIDTFVFESSQNVTKPSSVQAILEPKVGARFGVVAPSVGYVAPLGGRLGSTGAGGIRLHVDAYF